MTDFKEWRTAPVKRPPPTPQQLEAIDVLAAKMKDAGIKTYKSYTPATEYDASQLISIMMAQLKGDTSQYGDYN